MCPPSTPHIKSHFHHPLISAKSFIFLTLGFMGYRKKKVINIILCDFRPRKRGDPEVGRDDKQRTNVFESTLLRKSNDNLKLYRIILPHTYYPKMMETQAPGKRQKVHLNLFIYSIRLVSHSADVGKSKKKPVLPGNLRPTQRGQIGQ
jgi:hypothetical protein